MTFAVTENGGLTIERLIDRERIKKELIKRYKYSLNRGMEREALVYQEVLKLIEQAPTVTPGRLKILNWCDTMAYVQKWYDALEYKARGKAN